MRPLGNRLLVREIERDTVTPSGIIIPDTAKEKPTMGEIVSVGSDVAGYVDVGDVVLYGVQNSGVPVKDGEQEYLIIPYGECFAVL